MQHPGSTKTHATNTTTSARSRRSPQRPKARRSAHRLPAPTPTPTIATPSLRAALTAGRASLAERAEVDAMTRAARVTAMHQGRLSLRQLTYWSGRYGAEVPLIGGEFAYIAMFDPEYCEPSRPATQVRS